MSKALMSAEVYKGLELSLQELKDHYAPNATNAEFALYVDQVQANHLDPRKREVYFVKYGTAKAQIVTGYQVYTMRAQATGQLNGWNVEILDWKDADQCRAKITIKRKDWESPFTWETYLSDVDKGQSTWNSQKRFQLRKCCIAQGFRLAFPEVLGGMPYTTDELAVIDKNAPTDIEDMTKDVEVIKERIAKKNTAAKKSDPIKPGEVTETASPVTEAVPKAEVPTEPVTPPTANESVKPSDPPEDALGEDTRNKIIGAFAQFNIAEPLMASVIGKPSTHWTETERQWLLSCYHQCNDGDLDAVKFAGVKYA